MVVAMSKYQYLSRAPTPQAHACVQDLREGEPVGKGSNVTSAIDCYPRSRALLESTFVHATIEDDRLEGGFGMGDNDASIVPRVGSVGETCSSVAIRQHSSTSVKGVRTVRWLPPRISHDESASWQVQNVDSLSPDS